MKPLVLFAFSVLLMCSCSQKVHFLEAEKLPQTLNENEKIQVDAFFAGDALDYVVFELDVINNSNDSLYLDFRNVFLEVLEINQNNRSDIYALNPHDVIFDIEQEALQLKREKTGRDIEGVVSIGLNVLFAGSGNFSAIDAIVFSTETAAYMLEDSRAHKLVQGSIEEQIQYIDEWVLFNQVLGPNEENTWDILFERQLFNSETNFTVIINDKRYTVPFDIFIKEEKVR